MAFDATVKGTAANSYLTVADCQIYMDTRLDCAEWTAASTANKQAALVMATSRLEQERYIGLPTLTTQRLQWPRFGVPDANNWSSGISPYVAYRSWPTYGSYYSQDAIPRYVQEATCELALALLKDTTLLADTGLEGFNDLGVGPLRINPRHGRKAGTLPQQVQRLLRGLRETVGTQTAVLRG